MKAEPILTAEAPASSQRAILFVLAGMAAFTVGDTLMKLAAAELPTGQTIALRGVFASLMMTALARRLGALRFDASLATPALLIRTAAEMGSSVFFFLALFAMPIATCTAILQVVPLALTAASALLLREAVGWRRWSATAVGLAGVLLIVRPGTGTFGWPSLLALACVACIVTRDLATRRIDRTIPSMTIAWLTAVGVMLAGFALSFGADWVAPSSKAWMCLAGAGLTVLLGNLLIILSLRATGVATLAPFRYSAVVFAIVSGYVVWGEIPDRLTLLGIAVVTSAGLYTFHRERVRRQAATASRPSGSRPS